MIFINYNEKDKTSVEYLNQLLKNKNFSTWTEYEQLLAGDSLDIIEQHIKKSSNFIFCIGKNGVSDSQEKILTIAKKLEKKIIPLLLPNDETKVSHPILNVYTFVDFRKEFKDKVETTKLFKIINGETVNEKPELKEINEVEKSSKRTTKKAVSVALFQDNKILIVQRADSQNSGAGLWQLPGGKVDNNESNEQTAIREIKEEVGLDLKTNKLNYIGDFIDTWVIDSKDDYILMSLYIYIVDKTALDINEEFKSYKWISIQNIFENQEIIYFGSTTKYLKNVRRYVLTYLPLKELSLFIKKNLKSPKPLPKKLLGISEESTSVIYSFLSLMGFIADKGSYYPASTLSHQLINLLSEWALTDGVIFEAIEGSNSPTKKVRPNDNPVTMAKFKEGLFDHHSNLLGVLSHKLPKALSTRKVADLLIFGKSSLTDESLILVRWDFLANKYQIPSKGLEGIVSDIKNIETAKKVVDKRFNINFTELFDYEYFSKFETQHIGAGSLSLLEGDGPMLRNYIVSIFKMFPRENKSDRINEIINHINKLTIEYIDKTENSELKHDMKRDLNLYMWVSIKSLLNEPKKIVGEIFQGFSEILENVELNELENNNIEVVVKESEFVPITFSMKNSEKDHNVKLREKYANRRS
jgi:8-oxo-dGTP diphosphatase